MEPEQHLPKILEALAQAEHGAASGGMPKKGASGRWTRRRVGALATAVLVLCFGMLWLWWSVSPRQIGIPHPPRGLFLSLDDSEVRSPAITEARSGDAVYLHFDLDRPAWGFVALLEGRRALSAVSTSVRELKAGRNRLGPLVLDENPGEESLIVLVSVDPVEKAAFVKAIEDAWRAAEGRRPSHGETLPLVLDSFAMRAGWAAASVTYKHSPR